MPNSKNKKLQANRQHKAHSQKQKKPLAKHLSQPAKAKGHIGAATSKPHQRGREPFKKQIVKILIKAKEELLAEVNQKVKEETNTSKFEIGDIYDIASTERDREISLILGDRDREKLANIEDALIRVKDGTYGTCEECGEPIGEERLKILPFTKVCVDCKSKNEREHGSRKRYEEETGFGIIEKTETEEEF